MRADKLLMLGVVGLGAYAVYRMVRAPQLQGPSPGFDQPAGQPGALPAAPGTLPDPPVGSTVLPGGPTLHLRKGAWYRGRIETRAGQPVGRSAREEEREKIKRELQGMGFSSLPDATRVFVSPDELDPTRWALWATANPGQGTRWFWARWAEETGDVMRPAGFVRVWQAFAPAVA